MERARGDELRSGAGWGGGAWAGTYLVLTNYRDLFFFKFCTYAYFFQLYEKGSRRAFIFFFAFG